jgi:hypothetical protein
MTTQPLGSAERATTDYEVFQQPRPAWFVVNLIYRFALPLPTGAEVYNASGEVVATDAVDWRRFKPREMGGTIVFAPTLAESPDFLARLKKRVVGFLQSLASGKLGRFLSNRRHPGHENVAFSIGHPYEGKYWSHTEQVYDETSMAVEIVGIRRAVLIELATEIAREFDQREILVFDTASSRIYTVNRR